MYVSYSYSSVCFFATCLCNGILLVLSSWVCKSVIKSVLRVANCCCTAGKSLYSFCLNSFSFRRSWCKVLYKSDISFTFNWKSCFWCIKDSTSLVTCCLACSTWSSFWMRVRMWKSSLEISTDGDREVGCSNNYSTEQSCLLVSQHAKQSEDTVCRLDWKLACFKGFISILVGASSVFMLLKFSRDFFLRGFKVLLAIVWKATDLDVLIVVGFESGKNDWGVVGYGFA